MSLLLLFCSAVFRCTAEMQERTQNFDFVVYRNSVLDAIRWLLSIMNVAADH